MPSQPHPVLPSGPAPEGYGPALAVVLPPDFPAMAAGSLVYINGVKTPEPNSFKKRRTSPKLHVSTTNNPVYTNPLSRIGEAMYYQPAFFVDHSTKNQDSVSLQTTGILTVKVKSDNLPRPGQVLCYESKIDVGDLQYTILQPMTNDETQQPAAIVLNAEPIEGQAGFFVCRAFVSHIYDIKGDNVSDLYKDVASDKERENFQSNRARSNKTEGLYDRPPP